jgi:hypothetical protein
MLAPVDLDTLPDAPPVGCAFCGTREPDADVRTQERLGVQVAVCAACRERFAGAGTPVTRPPVVEEPRGLPPTLGQQSGAVFALVQRMARIAAERPYSEEECEHCGHPVHRYRDRAGDDVGLAKESVLAASVPAEERWRVVEDRAVPVTDLDTANGDDDEDQVGARVRHAVVCPANPAPTNPRLARMWSAHLTPPPEEH